MNTIYLTRIGFRCERYEKSVYEIGLFWSDESIDKIREMSMER